jgi:hypothetical protein
MMQPDQQPELSHAACPTFGNPPAGAGAAPGEAEMMASLARKLSAQPAVSAPTLLGTDLPLLALQVAAADSYRHAYGVPPEQAGTDAAVSPVGPTAKAVLITDTPAKSVGLNASADAQSGKPVSLKRRKVNANRFRARPNKPPE